MALITWKQGPVDNHTTIAATTVATAYGSNVTLGSLLVCMLNFPNTTGTITHIVDSLSQTWTPGILQQGNTQSCAVYYFMNSAAGACTVTATISSSTAELILYEFTGCQASGAIDGTPVGATLAASAESIGPLVTTNANDLLFSGVAVDGNVSAGTASWTFAASTNSNGTEYYIVSSTGSYTATYTPGNSWAGVILAFKDAGSGGTPQRTTVAPLSTSTQATTNLPRKVERILINRF